MKHTKFIFAAALAVAIAISAPLHVGASLVPPPEYEAQMTLIADGLYYEDTGVMTAGQYTVTVKYDDNWVINAAEITYGGEPVYDGPAGYAGTFPESVYLYEKGSLRLFENGGVKDVLTVARDLTCINVSESGGVVWAYFLDTQSRDIYAYNLEDGSSAKGNVGPAPVHALRDIAYAQSNDSLIRIGDYIAIRRIEEDGETQMSTVLKQEGGALTVFEPDISNVKNSNPKGKELILVGYADGFGYLDSTGTARGFYDNASAFYYNERGEGVAFVTVDGEGYFVDKYLNRVSDTMACNGAYCSKDGVFEIYFSENIEDTKAYTVELVQKNNPLTGIMLVFGLILVIAVAAVIITGIRKTQ